MSISDGRGVTVTPELPAAAPEPVPGSDWSWIDCLPALGRQHDELAAEAQLLRLQLAGVESQLDKHVVAMEKARELRELLRDIRPIQPGPDPEPPEQASEPPQEEAAPTHEDAVPAEEGPVALPEAEAPAVPRARRSLAVRTGRVAAAGVAAVLLAAMLLLSVGPRVLPYQSLVVRSGSMSPHIPIGSLVLYRRAAATQIKVGDVIVFAKPGNPDEKVTHRVYRISPGPNGRYFETKGDANGAPDAWRISATGSGWVAFAHVPDVGYVLGYLQTGSARMLLIVIPALLLGALTVVEIWRPRGGARRIAAA